MSNIVIGIEGLVGSGKTSICRELVNIIPNSIILHGGNLYRAIVYVMMKNGSKLEELKSQGTSLDIKDMMDYFKIKIEFENNESVIYVDGEKINEDDIQSKDASMAVSHIGGSADNTKLFVFARHLIDNLKQKYNVIVSGRTLMTIYPDLDYHFFIEANLDERVKRKCRQYENKESFDEIKDNIIKRDELQEKAGFYKKYEKTITVDVTECTSAYESAQKVLKYIK